MSRDDDAIWMLRQLEQLAQRLDVEIRYESLDAADEKTSAKSGFCRLQDRQLIIVESALPLREKCRILATELRRFDLSTTFVIPAIRALLNQ